MTIAQTIVDRTQWEARLQELVDALVAEAVQETRGGPAVAKAWAALRDLGGPADWPVLQARLRHCARAFRTVGEDLETLLRFPEAAPATLLQEPGPVSADLPAFLRRRSG